jgi:hypothetical protein
MSRNRFEMLDLKNCGSEPNLKGSKAAHFCFVGVALVEATRRTSTIEALTTEYHLHLNVTSASIAGLPRLCYERGTSERRFAQFVRFIRSQIALRFSADDLPRLASFTRSNWTF